MIFVIYVSLVLRLFLSTFHSEFSSLPGASHDAVKYHLEALKFYDLLNSLQLDFENYDFEIGWIYSSFLGFIYYLFSPSFILANYLSCFTWLISAHILRNVMIKLDYSTQSKIYGIITYSFLFPIFIIYASTTLREVYILLFFNLFALSIINILLEKTKLTKFVYFLVMLISSFFLIILHKSNIVFLGCFFILMILYFFINKINLSKVSILLLIFSSTLFLHFDNNLIKLFDQINDYQIGHFNDFDFFRANYYVKTDIEARIYSFSSTLIILFQNLLNYWAQPTFLKVANMPDIILFYENIFRFFLLLLALLKISNNFQNKHLFNILFIIYITMEFIYAQATVNWGTASRHHLPVFGILILIAFFPSKENKLKK